MKNIIINFGHPITDGQLGTIRTLVNNELDIDVLNIRVQVDIDKPLADETKRIIESIPLTTEDYSHNRIFINCAGFATIACSLLVSLNGLSGLFPEMITLKREDFGFSVSEIIDLQKLRNQMRMMR